MFSFFSYVHTYKINAKFVFVENSPTFVIKPRLTTVTRNELQITITTGRVDLYDGIHTHTL